MSFPKRRDTSVLNLESPDAIIYDFCDGDKEIPHREIITAERLPNAESFSDLKAESDSIYSAIHSGDRSYDDHTVSPFDDVDFGVSPSCEDVLIEAMDQRNKALFMERLVIYLLSGLSPKIRRRFVLRNEKNLLEKEIAEMEGVTPQAISKSLKKADAIIFERKCKLFMNAGCFLPNFPVLSEGDYIDAFMQLENKIHSVKGTKPAWPRGQRHKERRQDGI